MGSYHGVRCLINTISLGSSSCRCIVPALFTGIQYMNNDPLVAIARASKEARRNQRSKKKRESSSSKPLLALPSSLANAGPTESIRKLTIPQNEQDRLIKFLSDQSSLSPPVLNYLNCLVSPKNCMSRVPDSFARPTANVRSIITYDVPCYVDGTTNSGRFAVAVQPVLGVTENVNPKDWKVALVNGNTTWPTDFTIINSFTQIGGGQDLRVDPFFPTLTQNIPGFLNGDAVTPGILAPFTNNASYNVFTTYSLNIGYEIRSGKWYLPPGAYQVTFTSISLANTLIPTFMIPANANLQAGSLGPGTNPSAVYILNVQNPGEWFEITQANPSVTFWVTVSTTLTASGGAPTDYGLVAQIRPVGMSVLASYIGTTLQDGGNIAAAYVPGGTLGANYFTNASAISPLGCFEFWEALSKQPTSYNGPIRDGAYVWWSPEDYEDLQMVKPSGIDDHDYPAIVVSGQFLPGPYSGTPASVPVIRLEVVTVYEFVTNSLLFETSSVMGSQAMMDSASQALFGQPHSMANAIHMKWLSDLAKGIKKGIGTGVRYIASNPEKLLPLMGSVAKLL